jgi:hypothetical protein
MSSYVKLATDAGDQYLAALAEAQENVLKSIASFSFPSAFAAPTPAFAAALPTPAEVTEASFAFAQKLLKLQRDFTEKLLATGTSASR